MDMTGYKKRKIQNFSTALNTEMLSMKGNT